MSLLGAMIREEWRLHAQLFGGRRFAAFPLAMVALAAAGLTLLAELGVDRGAVVGGLAVLVAFLGLQVGTLGLVGRDAMRSVLGDVTLLVSSYRTLPITWRRLLATFVLKDLLYYTALILAPLALADGLRAAIAGASPLGVGVLWVTLAGAFTLGVTGSLALIAVGTRHRGALLGIGTLLVASIARLDIDVLAFTPVGFYGDPSVAGALRAAIPIVVLGAVAFALFEPIETSRQSTSRLGTLPVGDGVTGRTLRTVARSDGSVWNVLFSLSVFGAITGWLVVMVAEAAGLDFAPGVAFATLLGLGTFTTYAWVTQFDTTAEYRRYPLPARQLLAGKLVAFLLLAVPSSLALLTLCAIWYPPTELVVGGLIAPGIALYVFSVSALLAGLSPTEVLFDVARFAAFGAAMAAVAVPLLVLAFVAGRYPSISSPLAAGIAMLAGVSGLAMLGPAARRVSSSR